MMRRASLIIGTVCVAVCAVAMASPEAAKQKDDRKSGERRREAAARETTGTAIGEKAPAFALKDQAGKERRLDEWLKSGKLAVVFYRSAGW